MGNLFDNLQNKTFDIVGNTMGENASWVPSGGGSEQIGRVLFNDPSKKYKLMGVDYQPSGWSIEYRDGVFAGLYDSVRQGNEETITLNGSNYFVRAVSKDFDGKTYVAEVELS